MSNCINYVCCPWTGSLPVLHNPTKEEKEEVNLPDQIPDFATHGRWYQVTANIFNELENSYGREIVYTLDAWTGDLYLPDPANVIRTKCGFSLLANSMHLMGAMAVNIASFYVDLVRDPIHAACEFKKDLEEEDGYIQASLNFGKKMVVKLPSDLFNDAWGVGRAIYYAHAIQASLFYGLVYPEEGRAEVAAIENRWNHGRSYRNDVRKKLDPKVKSTNNSTPVFYLDWCFQKRGSIYEKVGETNRFKIVACNPIPTNPVKPFPSISTKRDAFFEEKERD
jgi:hypothetical protein